MLDYIDTSIIKSYNIFMHRHSSSESQIKSEQSGAVDLSRRMFITGILGVAVGVVVDRLSIRIPTGSEAPVAAKAADLSPTTVTNSGISEAEASAIARDAVELNNTAQAAAGTYSREFTNSLTAEDHMVRSVRVVPGTVYSKENGQLTPFFKDPILLMAPNEGTVAGSQQLDALLEGSYLGTLSAGKPDEITVSATLFTNDWYQFIPKPDYSGPIAVDAYATQVLNSQVGNYELIAFDSSGEGKAPGAPATLITPGLVLPL